MRARTTMRRDQNETEATARARAETDPATRARITYAHEQIADAHGVDPKTLRRVTRDGLTVTAEQVHRAGLTLGEARASGLKVAG